MRRAGVRLDVPVLCVGNFVVGGAGKTPLALALLRRLLERGQRPAFLSRGYGRDRTRAGVVRVDPARHAAAEVGDEPLLLARLAPDLCVGRPRRGGRRPRSATAPASSCSTMACRTRPWPKTSTIAVVDGAAGIGNGLCMPAGPLRAPLADQWPFVSALCVIGDGDRGHALADEALA